MAFDSNQLPMAIFLLVAAVFNIWFVVTSYQRAYSRKSSGSAPSDDSSTSYQLVSYAVSTMATCDILWVWLCMIQCWNNSFNQNSFNQNSGDDSFGCKFMGWYSSFSLVGMMGSHCLVAYYLMNYFNKMKGTSGKSSSFLNSTNGWMALSALIVIAACLFASMPLMEGSGYALTSGGFCYADFTNKAQSSAILSLTLAFLTLSTIIWVKIANRAEYWYYYAIFFCTWVLWIPAASYGISNGVEIGSPYMLIGAIVGHANAIINPLLYGRDLWRKLSNADESVGHEFKEATEIA